MWTFVFTLWGFSGDRKFFAAKTLVAVAMYPKDGTMLSEQAREMLSDLKIYLNTNYTFAHAALYGYVAMTYNSASFLESNGNDPKKKYHIEIYNVSRYINQSIK